MNIIEILKQSKSYGNCYFYFILVFLFNLVVVGPLASYLGADIFLWLGRSLYCLLFIAFLVPNLHIALNNRLFFLITAMGILIVFCFILTPSVALQKVAFKDYIIPLITLFSVLYIKIDENKAKNIYQFVRWISLIQLPFIIQQFFFQAHSSTVRVVDWDLISGTFGFNSNGGGGNSAGFVLFQMFVLTLIFIKYKKQVLERIDYIALICIFITILMAETKIFIILFLLMIFSVYSLRQLFRISTLSKVLPLGILVVALMLNFYKSNTFDTSEGQTTSDYVEKVYNDYFEKKVINYETGEVGRSMAIIYWIEEQHTNGWPIESYIGYGLTTSKYSNSHLVEAESFGSYINFASSQLSIYLWDIGIIGVLLFYSIILLFLTRTVLLLRITVSPYLYYLRTAALFAFFASLIYPLYSTTLHSSSISQIIYLISFMSIFTSLKAKCE
ncbi:MAG: hypothetical protein HRU24_05090 [Gammaproteobacteria bacterium]|nr:hypothetical protein [Gammaproteobacteria bacterium]